MKLTQRTTILVTLGAAGWTATAAAQPGLLNPEFGPAHHEGSFYTMLNNRSLRTLARAVKTDPTDRTYVLQEWREPGGVVDCAVQRYVQNGLLVDMDYTPSSWSGPVTARRFEATRRIAFDLGGTNADTCNDLELDAGNRAYVFGTAARSGYKTGVIARLNAAGGFDDLFHGDGKVSLVDLGITPIGDIELRDGIVLPNNKIVACGSITGPDPDMVVVQLTSSGQLDTTFAGGGFIRYGFDGWGDNDDHCEAITRTIDGKLILAGHTADSSTPSDAAFAAIRLDENGRLDTSFANNGKFQLDVDAAGTGSGDRAFDVVHDSWSDRTYLIGTSDPPLASARDKGVVVALDNQGALATAFNTIGILHFRFHDRDNTRGLGDTRLFRGVIHGASLYVLGDHRNNLINSPYGDYDVGIASFTSSGAFRTAHDGDGVSYSSFNLHSYQEVEEADGASTAYRLRIDEVLADAELRDGRLTIAFSAQRFPSLAGNPAGQLAPALAQIVVGGSYTRPGYWGIDPNVHAPIANAPNINPSPLGTFGRYCSIVTPSGTSATAVGSVTDDPCQALRSRYLGASVVRDGLYSVGGENQALLTCADNGQDHPARGFGAAPIATLESLKGNRPSCVITVAPMKMHVFSRPYQDDIAVATSTFLFSHAHPIRDLPDDMTISVDAYGQTPDPNHPYAHAVDRFGRQLCDASSDHTVDGYALHEPALDQNLPAGSMIEAVGPGIVLQAVPRYVIEYSSLEISDPYQREVMIGHEVGSGDYAEQLWSFYAHMEDTRVRVGDIVGATTRLGLTGDTGAAGGVHLHFAAGRINNLSFRRFWDFSFDHRNWGHTWPWAIDPYGWQADIGHDPWAYLFHGYPKIFADSGAFSSELWLPGEAPPTDEP